MTIIIISTHQRDAELITTSIIIIRTHQQDAQLIISSKDSINICKRTNASHPP